MPRGAGQPHRPLWEASASVTAGLKCASEIGPKVRINVTRAALGAMASAWMGREYPSKIKTLHYFTLSS